MIWVWPCISLDPGTAEISMGRLLNSICPRAMDCRAAAFGPPALVHREYRLNALGLNLLPLLNSGTERLQGQEQRAAKRAWGHQVSRLIVVGLRGEQRCLQIHDLPQVRIRRLTFWLGMHQDCVFGLAARRSGSRPSHMIPFRNRRFAGGKRPPVERGPGADVVSGHWYGSSIEVMLKSALAGIGSVIRISPLFSSRL